MADFYSPLKNEESAVFALRSLYSSYGYLPYKMSKFEEYDLYVRNKDFLVSDSIITFNDIGGKLLALKPDVTLSIVKNTAYEKGVTQKLFYNENVYRVSGSTHVYKEIMQTGLECIGDVSVYDISEVLFLSLSSLQKMGGNFVLDVSSMGVVSALLSLGPDDSEFRKKITRCIGEKNPHGIKDICKEYGVSEKTSEKLCEFVRIYGKGESVFSRLRALSSGEEMEKAVSELQEIYENLSFTPLRDKINFDFSIINDMSYYNGVVFKGYIDGIPESVLSGGQYDKLMKKMGKKGKAVGFAVYLDLLDELRKEKSSYDVDILLLYGEATDKKELADKVNRLVSEGKSVSVQKAVPEKLRYKEIVSI